MIECPICSKPVKDSRINEHIDSDCKDHLVEQEQANTPKPGNKAHSFFTPGAHKPPSATQRNGHPTSSPPLLQATQRIAERAKSPPPGTKRSFDEAENAQTNGDVPSPTAVNVKRAKRLKAVVDAMPLAERMRPTSLDDVCGQELVGPNGMLRAMIEQGKLPSMVLWGRPGTGKTTIARLIANTSGARFVEINSTSTKLEEVRKIFSEAVKELHLTHRKTIVFCDELHRFSKTQQDAFLGPVESGTITLIAATTENPSFKVISALLSRCRTFTLDDLKEPDLVRILERAMATEECTSPLLDSNMLQYFARFSDGDARTALNLLDLAMNLSKNPDMTKEKIQQSLTKPSSTIAPATNTTTPSPPCTNPSAAPTPTPHFTTSHACSSLAKTHATSPGALSSSHPKMLVSQIIRYSPSRPPPTPPARKSACPNAVSTWPTQ